VIATTLYLPPQISLLNYNILQSTAMIQRIQSVFFLLAGGLYLGLFGVPFAETKQAVTQSAFLNDAAYGVQDHVALMAAFAVAGALSIAAIFLFKNRALQMRLALFSTIAAIVGSILTVVLFMQEGLNKSKEAIDDGLGLYMTIAALVFTVLAYRFVNKDEKLVRSADRLR
jgi:Domain of unknown function (DUF4293)